MQWFVRLALLMVPLLILAGCDTKPKPAETPKQLIEPPKGRPTPSGGGSKAPPQTSQVPRAMMGA